MTEQEVKIIAELSKMATDIMHERSAVVTRDPNARADRLEIATRYLLCAAIINGEVPYSKLHHLTD